MNPPAANPTSLLRIAVAGCGEVTRAKHLPALMRVPGVQVVAVCDPDVEKCRKVAQQFGIAQSAPSLAEILAQANLDAVGICTDPASHPELAIAAIGAGKHVLVEKPLALSPAECRQMMAAAAEAGVVAMTGFHMRFHRLVRRLRRLLSEGAVGRLESLRMTWHSPRGDQVLPAWKTRRSRGGGALVEIAVHHLDLVRFLTGGEIEEVFACSISPAREDECAVLAARTSSGALVSAEFSERSPHEIEIVASGQKGQIRLDCLRFDGLQARHATDLPGDPAVRTRSMLRSVLAVPEGFGVQRRGGDYRISYQREWQHFANAIRTHTVPEATFHDGLRATEALAAALRSSASGASVRVPADGSPGPAHAPFQSR